MQHQLFFDQRVQPEVRWIANIRKVAANVAELKLRCSGKGRRVEVLPVILDLWSARQRRGKAGSERSEGSDRKGIRVVRRRNGDWKAARMRVNSSDGPVTKDHGGHSVIQPPFAYAEWQFVMSTEVHDVGCIQIGQRSVAGEAVVVVVPRLRSEEAAKL